MHKRQQIREAVKTLLIAANTAAGAKVYETRLIPWREVELPAIALYTMNETIDEANCTVDYLRRTLQLEIVAAARATDNVDDTLDSLALQIETAMIFDAATGSTHETLSGLCKDVLLSETEIAIEIDGNKPIGMVKLTFTVTYDTSISDYVVPDTLDTVKANYSVFGDVATADQAQDSIEDLET
jgi:hypothetical protein